MRKSFFEQTNGTVERLHKQISRELTVFSYDWDDAASQNEYADGDWNESSESVTGTVRNGGSDFVADESGAEVTHDANIWLRPDSIDVNLGTADRSRATEILDSTTGQRYRVVGLSNEDSLVKVECTEI